MEEWSRTTTRGKCLFTQYLRKEQDSVLYIPHSWREGCPRNCSLVTLPSASRCALPSLWCLLCLAINVYDHFRKKYFQSHFNYYQIIIFLIVSCFYQFCWYLVKAKLSLFKTIFFSLVNSPHGTWRCLLMVLLISYFSFGGGK